MRSAGLPHGPRPARTAGWARPARPAVRPTARTGRSRRRNCGPHTHRTHTHAHTHAHTNTHTHARAHARTPTHPHARTHTTRTHTHTHARTGRFAPQHAPAAARRRGGFGLSLRADCCGGRRTGTVDALVHQPRRQALGEHRLHLNDRQACERSRVCACVWRAARVRGLGCLRATRARVREHERGRAWVRAWRAGVCARYRLRRSSIGSARARPR